MRPMNISKKSLLVASVVVLFASIHARATGLIGSGEARVYDLGEGKNLGIQIRDEAAKQVWEYLQTQGMSWTYDNPFDSQHSKFKVIIGDDITCYKKNDPTGSVTCDAALIPSGKLIKLSR